MMATGKVLSLNRWPVKSLGGEPVDAFRLTRRGVGGDRAHALFHEHKGALKRLTIRTAPRMLQWSAAYPGAPGDRLDPDDPPTPLPPAPAGAAAHRSRRPGLRLGRPGAAGRPGRRPRAPGLAAARHRAVPGPA